MQTTFILTLALIGAGTAAATPLPEAIFSAHGGRDRLSGLQTYQARYDVTRIHVHDSPDPGPPWSTSAGVMCLGRNLGNGRQTGYRRMAGSGFRPRHDAWLAGSAGAWNADLYDGWLLDGTGSPSDVPASELERLTPPLVLRQLLDAGERLSDLGTVADGNELLRAYRYLTANGEPMLLDFNADTHLLRRRRLGRLTVTYDEYQSEGGLAVSHRMSVSRDGDEIGEYALRAARVNEPLAPGILPPASLERVSPPPHGGGPGIQVRELDDGVFQVGADRRYQVFVDFRDFLVALGGLGGVEPRLAALRERVGDKPLRYALLTHHHQRHLEGVPALVDEGAVLVASPAHEARIRAAAGPARTPRFAFVTDRNEITDGQRDLLFLELGPTRHSRHLLGAYLPRERLLFTADLLAVPGGGPLPAGDDLMRDLYDGFRKRGLDPLHFAGTHAPGTTQLARLKSALGKKGRMDGFAELRSTMCPH